MRVVCFRYYGRFGHFLRAESNVNWLTYPLPTRTTLLGLVGAILGIEKGQPQELLKDARLAVGGRCPATHWHKANIRQSLPAALSYTVRAGAKGSEKEQKNAKQIPQEWLLAPDYTVYASLPGPWQGDLEARLRDQRWHFGLCLGLSEMIARVGPPSVFEAASLPEGEYTVDTAVPLDEAELVTPQILKERLALRFLRMPHQVTADRVFSLRPYAIESEGRPLPVRASTAWQVGDATVMFL